MLTILVNLINALANLPAVLRVWLQSFYSCNLARSYVAAIQRHNARSLGYDVEYYKADWQTWADQYQDSVDSFRFEVEYHIARISTQYRPLECSDGVCAVSWKPSKSKG
jgi:hypothetical protein